MNPVCSMTLRRAGEPMVLHPVEVAERVWSRTVGLLGRDGLDAHSGMLITRCRSIHTFFMRFNIDVAYLDEEYKVIDMAHNLPPGRFSVCRGRGGRYALELKGGTLEKNGISIGDVWRLHSQT